MSTRRIVGLAAAAIIVTLASISSNAQSMPAFPGAQGGGAVSVGGRGGVICEVTNLNDSGTGSLRQCAEVNSGPRIVVFRVGGTINLTTKIRVQNPYITIAGQTAPGGGILISGKKSANYGIQIVTHDVVIQYVRVRMGSNPSRPPGSQQGSCVWVGSSGGEAYNIMLHHLSISWTTDECLTIWRPADTAAPRNITFSHGIISEALAGHSTNIGVGCATVTDCGDAMVDLDYHHSLIGWASHRNPLFANKRTRFVNNITYNYSFYAAQSEGGTHVDYINNLWKAGPVNDPAKHEIQQFVAGFASGSSGAPSLYVVGNKGPHNSDPNVDNWTSMVREITTQNGSEIGVLSNVYKRLSPLSALQFAITASPVVNLESEILPIVGASRRLDCNGAWVANRDAVDTRLITEYSSNQGKIPNPDETAVGGFPTIVGGTACTDTDHDGMPDAWETAHALNPNNASDRSATAPNGFTNIENFLNGVSAVTAVSQPEPPTGLAISVN